MSGVLHGVVASLKAAAAAATDAFFEYVTLLLNTSATNGAQNNTFLDSSTNNFTVTRNGDTTQGSFNPYMPSGYWSGFFDGTDDRLTVADNAALRPGTGNFTIEAWVFRTASGAAHTIYAKGGASTGFVFQITSGNVLRFTNTTTNIDSTGTVAANTWVHVAVVREGTGTNQLKLYINGTNDGQGTVSTNFNQTEELRIGENRGATEDFAGYISNVRFATTAVYTANFTPSTTPLTAITNTSLLCLQDNRFIDNSTNAFAITRNGDTRISKFAPFNPPASYSTAAYGGSGYFDGTGDYLGIADSTAFDLNSTFTVECWFYQPAAGDGMFFGRGGGVSSWSTTNGHQYLLFIQTGTIYWMWNNAGFNTQISTASPSAGQWHHIAVGYNGTTTRMWIDGVSIGTSAVAYTLPTTRNITRVGLGPDGALPLTGYVSNLRVVKGTDVYGVGNTTITPPTTPLTAITNTSLLLNFTNAGIFDAATINDGQTVGNAQVSTTQAKWSPTSMAFDGTGDWLVVPNRPELNIGTGDFTIECWINRTATASGAGNGDALISKGTNNVVISMSVNTSKFEFGQYGVAALLTSTTVISNNTWYHVAITRSGTTLRMFIDGTQEASTTSSANFTSTTNMFIGADANNTNQRINGYIQDLRITNGYARYTANFTAPTAAFPTL